MPSRFVSTICTGFPAWTTNHFRSKSSCSGTVSMLMTRTQAPAGRVVPLRCAIAPATSRPAARQAARPRRCPASSAGPAASPGRRGRGRARAARASLSARPPRECAAANRWRQTASQYLRRQAGATISRASRSNVAASRRVQPSALSAAARVAASGEPSSSAAMGAKSVARSSLAAPEPGDGSQQLLHPAILRRHLPGRPWRRCRQSSSAP